MKSALVQWVGGMADWSEVKDTEIRLNNWQGLRRFAFGREFQWEEELGREKTEVKRKVCSH